MDQIKPIYNTINGVVTKINPITCDQAVLLNDGRTLVDLVDDVIVTKNRKLDLIRKSNPYTLSKYSHSDVPLNPGLNVNVYKDGHSFYTDFIKDSFINTSKKTYYISSYGDDTSDGLSRITSFKTLDKAISAADINDTIVICEGIYGREMLQSVKKINKSINIIGTGDVKIFYGDKLTYSKVEGYNNIYKTTQSNVTDIVDITTHDEGYKYYKASSLQEVENTKGSYYIDGTTINVHTLTSREPNNNVFVLVNDNFFNLENATANTNIYIENIKLYGGVSGTLSISKTQTSELIVCLDNVWMLHAGLGGNALNAVSGKIVLHKCKAMYSDANGFAYSYGNTSTDCYFIEIDCIGANNGSINGKFAGSVVNNAAKGYRINSTYYNNHGPNIYDNGSATKTINLGCNSYDSGYTKDTLNNLDYLIEGTGAEALMDECILFGSTININSATGTKLIVKNSQYDTITKSGNVSEINPK